MGDRNEILKLCFAIAVSGTACKLESQINIDFYLRAFSIVFADPLKIDDFSLKQHIGYVFAGPGLVPSQGAGILQNKDWWTFRGWPTVEYTAATSAKHPQGHNNHYAL